MYTVKIYRFPENGDCATKKEITEKEMGAWVNQYVLVRKFENFSELKTYVNKDIFKDVFEAKTLPKMIEIYRGDWSLISHAVVRNIVSAVLIEWTRGSQFYLDRINESDNEDLEEEDIEEEIISFEGLWGFEEELEMYNKNSSPNRDEDDITIHCPLPRIAQ